MSRYRNSDWKISQYVPPSKEDALKAITAMIFFPNSYDNRQWRINLAGAISVLGLSETWDGDSEISSSYTGELTFMVSLCESIRDCILNNQETKDAILGVILEGGYYPSATIKPIIEGEGATNLLEGLDCDGDSIKGYAKAIIEYCNAVALDAIQVFSSETSESLFAARVLDYIPLLGDIPLIDDLSDTVTWLTTTLALQYESGYTEELLDDLVCAIYEKACPDCFLSAHDLMLAIAQVAGFPFTSESSFLDVIRLLTGEEDDRLVALMFIATVVAALGTGSKVLGYVGVKGIKQIIANAPPYVLEDCEVCPPEWCYTFDFTASDGGFLPLTSPNTFGTWSSSGWSSRDVTLSSQLTIYKTLLSTALITRVVINGVYVNALDNGNNVYFGVDGDLPSNPSPTEEWTHSGSGAFSKEWNGLVSSDTQIWLGGYNLGGGGNEKITSVRFEGQGTNPFGTDNC